MTQNKHKRPPYPNRHSKAIIESVTEKLDADLARLSQSVLPRCPYLISVPSDVPYRHSSRFVPTWFVGLPFDRREEQLQYLSFLPHQSQEEELLRVVGGWSDDQGNFLEDEPSPRTVFDSGRNTPLDQSTRKKISLKAYKTKDKMATDQDHAPSQEPIKNSDSLKLPPHSPDKPAPKTAKERDSTQDIARSPSKITELHESISNSIPHLDGALPVTSPPVDEEAADVSPRPHKRRKLSESPVAHPMQRNGEASDTKAMPQLLSPTLPSTPPPNGLPELLSPILPPTLVKAIATPPPVQLDNGQQHLRSESVRSILAGAINEGSPRPDNRTGPASGSLGSHMRSDSTHSARSTTPNGQAPNRSVAALKPNTPNISPSRSPRPRQRHIIVLKYGKKNRKRVEALLKFASRPKKAARTTDEGTADDRDSTSSQVTSMKSSKDKPVEYVAKSKAAQQSIHETKRPSTPVPAIKEPKHSPTPTPDGKSSVHATPKKELKSTAMRRVESVEAADPATPEHKPRSSTPLSVDRPAQPSKLSPGPTSAPQTSNEDRHAWIELHQKYFELGRTIKHNATRDNEPGSPRYTVLLVEALLAFMADHTAQSLARPSADIWSTIEDYLDFVANGTRKQSHLHGLVLQLGAVCRQQIHKYDLDRLARDPLPEDYAGSAPTPGSDGHTKPTDDGERYKHDYLKHRTRMMRNARSLQAWWLDGSRRLSIELLKSDYPTTWKARRTDFERRGIEKPIPSHIPKGFFLPIDAATAPLEAIHFGLAFLTEWTDVMGVEWEARVVL